jgi:predicted lipid-binding transport protein (Tim44 family)
MNSLLIGGALAAVFAGPRLYSMVQSGQLDGTTALLRGLLVAAVCAVGVTYLQRLVAGYDREWERTSTRENLLTAIAEAEAAKKRQEEAAAVAAKAKDLAANADNSRQSS